MVSHQKLFSSIWVFVNILSPFGFCKGHFFITQCDISWYKFSLCNKTAFVGISPPSAFCTVQENPHAYSS